MDEKQSRVVKGALIGIGVLGTVIAQAAAAKAEARRKEAGQGAAMQARQMAAYSQVQAAQVQAAQMQAAQHAANLRAQVNAQAAESLHGIATRRIASQSRMVNDFSAALNGERIVRCTCGARNSAYCRCW